MNLIHTISKEFAVFYFPFRFGNCPFSKNQEVKRMGYYVSIESKTIHNSIIESIQLHTGSK